jgi:hypothetical protein
VPPGVVTSTLTDVPVVPAGEVAVIDVAELTVTPVAALVPKETVEPLTNPVPVMVTVVPALPLALPSRADRRHRRSAVGVEVAHRSRTGAARRRDLDVDRRPRRPGR